MKNDLVLNPEQVEKALKLLDEMSDLLSIRDKSQGVDCSGENE